jgi:hypothetical protein
MQKLTDQEKSKIINWIKSQKRFYLTASNFGDILDHTPYILDNGMVESLLSKINKMYPIKVSNFIYGDRKEYLIYLIKNM